MRSAWARTAALVVGVALAGTLALGVYLRWGLTGSFTMVGRLDHLRHAHSHLGYYGVLFPLAWLALRRNGVPGPGRAVAVAYALATAVAFFGFLRAGYGPEAIVGSTIVGAVWLGWAWQLRGRLGRWTDPLGVVPLGIIASLSCVPPIALTLRRDPTLARNFVATFLTALLLAVIVPAALAAAGRRVPGWPLALVAALGGSLALGVWPRAPAWALLAVYAVGLLIAGVRSGPWHLRCAWAGVAIGLGAMAIGLLPNVRPIAIGSIHFVVLAPVLGSLAPGWLRTTPPDWAWWLYLVFVGVLSGSLVLQGLGLGPLWLTVSAVGGSLIAAWWITVAVAQVRTR